MKKITALALVLIMLITLFAGCKKDEEVKEPVEPVIRQVVEVKYHEAATSFAGGTGIAEDPYQISNVNELVYLGTVLENNDYSKANYILTADIALNDISDFDNWATDAPEYGWKPIGDTAAAIHFDGVLDGNGHKITGMFMDVDGNQTETPNDYYGLFAELRGTVKNLTVESSYVRGSGNLASIGTVAGHTLNAKIENCNANTVIELYNALDAGGIVGKGGSVSNCTYSGTITEYDDKSFVNMGGIVGYAGDVENCTFAGTLSGKEYAGGIAGWGGNINNCINKGTVSGNTAGGIVGNVYEIVNTSGEKQHKLIENCINEGKVSGTVLAGGIVGNMGIASEDYSVSVIKCENKGEVACDKSVAGVVGKIMVDRCGVIKLEDCVNRSDVSGKGETGGIICHLTGANLNQKGDVIISGCQNFGNITSESLYGGGIIAYFLVMGDKTDLRVTVENCTNEGVIQSLTCAGGILGFSNVSFNAEVMADGMNLSDNTKIALNNCNNKGKVKATNSNSVAGGIVGALGMGYISTEVTNCTNIGAVNIDFTLTDEQIVEGQGSEWNEFYQIGGGIIGRIGDAIKLTTAEGVETNYDNVNSKSANIKISGCRSTGTVTAPDYSFILNKWEKPLYVNYLGGIVGQCSATDGYAFGVENCTYSGAERGLGDTTYADFGTKK